MTTEFDKIAKEQDEQTAIEKGASKETIYTIDIPGTPAGFLFLFLDYLEKILLWANRHDLLGLEGLCSGLNIFLGNSQPIEYKKTEAQYTLRVTPSVTFFLSVTLLWLFFYMWDEANSTICCGLCLKGF